MKSNLDDLLRAMGMDSKPNQTTTNDARDKGVRLGFGLAQRAAAQKAKQLGYDALAKEIEAMSIGRKK